RHAGRDRVQPAQSRRDRAGGRHRPGRLRWPGQSDHEPWPGHQLPAEDFGAMAGRQTSILAFFVPFLLVFIADGVRGLRQAWPAALTAGVTFAVSQFLFSMWNYKVCDIFAALISGVLVVLLVQVW